MAVDASSAIIHLHSQSILHRDVAARNFLVDSYNRACVSDFGMSVAVTNDEFMGPKEELLPVAWTAPEALLHRRFSRASDVYSFGVFLLELVAQDEPYPGKELRSLVPSIVHDSVRPVIPGYCHNEYADIMLECWHADPGKRLTMAQVNKRLEALRMKFAQSQHLPTTWQPAPPTGYVNPTAYTIADAGSRYQMCSVVYS